MVFGFFSRKSTQQNPIQGTDDNGASPSSNVATPASQNVTTGTPSFDISPPSPSPNPGPEDSPSPAPEDQVTDPAALYALISSVPAQTLHAYTLLHLAPPPPSPFPVVISTPALLGQAKPLEPPSPRVLTALSQFFSSLRPPPQLHCVRCHKGYFELENTDSACHIAHDDDSAIVERVKTSLGSEYETLWGCCGKTVEGDGDMGPPDGWCYEGRHTTDLKRARFRADSTTADDKLSSCASLRCHEPPAPTRSSRARGGARKRNRQTMELDNNEQNDDDDHRSVTSSRHARSNSQSISVASNKGKGRALPEDNDDLQESTSQKRPAKRQKSRKPSASIRMREDADGDVVMDMDQTQLTGTPPPTTSTTSPPKSPQRKRKSTATTPKPISKSSTSNNVIHKSPLSASFTVPQETQASTAAQPHATSVPISRASSTSPTRKGKSARRTATALTTTNATTATTTMVEVSIPLGRKGSMASLKKKASMASLTDREGQQEKEKPRAKPKPRAVAKKNTKSLGEVVDTSVDGEEWHQ